MNEYKRFVPEGTPIPRVPRVCASRTGDDPDRYSLALDQHIIDSIFAEHDRVTEIQTPHWYSMRDYRSMQINSFKQKKEVRHE